MKRIIFFLLAIMFSLAPYAQKTVHKKPVKKTAVANRKHQAQRKPAARRAKHLPRQNAVLLPIAMLLSEDCRGSVPISSEESGSRSRLCARTRLT